ncbi:hypothetical protein B0H17DRAFT_1149209 [Mycena rosella]|uniref:Uncharacterized protein n=1 Tax=Mycena rosella TaxID=1033263 RepID=A0AAD7C3E5_MYCRO|nr:hypothetical protein B0H17DRAFT_1149209 [Mycena rosella]
MSAPYRTDYMTGRPQRRTVADFDYLPSEQNAVAPDSQQWPQRKNHGLCPANGPVIRRQPVVNHQPTTLLISHRAPPSHDSLHPYRLLGLRPTGSGNYSPPPAPAHCAECRADSYIETVRERYANPVDVVPSSKFRGPACGNPVLIEFKANKHPALVADILDFRACMDRPGSKLLKHDPGPLQVTLQIEGFPPVDDIVFATCAHRLITKFNLGWWLAFHLRALVEHEFRCSVDGMELLSLSSPDGNQWTALARYGR